MRGELVKEYGEYVSVTALPDGSWQVWLVVGVQSFQVGMTFGEGEESDMGLEEAHWYAAMLLKAVEGIQDA